MIGEHIDAYEQVEDATAGAADALSPSSVRCWSDCQFKWYGRYVMQWEDPPTSALSIGTCVHDAQGANFEQKILSKEDLPVEGVVALFRESWSRQVKITAFRDDEDPKALGDCGAGLIRKYMSEVSPKIQPVAVEQKLHGVIGGVRINARLDVLDETGKLIEIKTMGARRPTINPMHRFQVATYRRLEPRASGLIQLDGLIKTRTPGVMPQAWEVTDADIAMTENLFPLAQEQMRSGYVWPNRFSVMCSRRACAYWKQCELEFGGTVNP